MSDSDARREFQRTLSRRLAAARGRVVLHGLLAWGALAAAVTLLAAWILGGAQAPAVGLKVGLAASCLALLAAALQACVVRPVRRLRSREELCRQLERDGDFANALVAAEEACRRRDRWDRPDEVTRELVRRLFARVSELAARLSLGRLLPLPWAVRSLLGILAMGLVLAAGIRLAPERLHEGYARLLAPWRPENLAATVGLYPDEGPGTLVAGQDAVLAALDFGAAESPVVCEVRSGTSLWQSLGCVPDSLSTVRTFRRWLARLPAVDESFVYRFQRGGLATPERQVTVVHPPLLTELTGRLEPPAYTGLAAQELSSVPALLEVLSGSRLTWLGRVNHPVEWAALVTADSDTLALAHEGGRVRGSLLVEGPFTYALHLRDANGLTGVSQLEYRVEVLEDMPPLVHLERPGDDGLLPVSGRLSLGVEAADDFGLARLDLLCRRDEAEGDGSAGRASASPSDTPRDPASDAAADSAAFTNDGWYRATLWRPDPAGSASGPVTLATPFGELTARLTPGDSSGSRLRLASGLEVNADALELFPGDVLSLRVDALDNREPGPAGVGRSRVLRLTLPSAAEILVSQATEERSNLDDMAELRRRSALLGEDLARLDRELQKNPLPDWSRQQEMEQAIDRQNELQAELQRLAQTLQADLGSLIENHLTSAELAARMDQIAALLEAVRNARLDDLLARLREAVAKLSAAEIRQAMEDVAAQQQDFLNRLDRALAMLKELGREQELEGLTSLLAQMIRQQQDLLEASRRQDEAQDQAQEETPQEPSDRQDAGQEAQPQGKDEAAQQDRQQAGEQDQAGAEDARTGEAQDEAQLAERQEALAQELQRLEERLRQQLAELQEEQAAGQDSPSAEELKKSLQQALQELARRQPGQNMQRAGQHLQQQQSDQAIEPQEQALRDLAALYHVLLASQEAMQMALMQHQVASLRGLAADLLLLSERQEEIADKIPSNLRDVRTDDLARQQFRVLKGSRALRDHLQATPGADPMEMIRLLQKLDDLIGRLDVSVRNLQAGRGAVAQENSRESLGAMNEIVIGLLTQAQRSCQGGACPRPSMGQQLKQMAKDQAGLNGLTEQLRQQLARGQLSEQLRSQMERLQSDQSGLARQVEDLAREERVRPDGERLLGNMDHLADEMEHVARDLADGLVTDETLERQERILGRLLDAHNAARERDFSPRRESRSADRVFARQQGEDANATPTEEDPFQLRYQPVEKAPLEYRELVRRYFRAIEQLHRADPHGTGAEGLP